MGAIVVDRCLPGAYQRLIRAEWWVPYSPGECIGDVVAEYTWRECSGEADRAFFATAYLCRMYRSIRGR